MKDKILLFIPGYNCENQVIRVLNQLDSKVMSYISSVIMVNNRSTDKTEEVVSSYINEHPDFPLTLLRNDENYGLGGSHKVAFSYAIENNYDYVIVLHGDDQGSIHDILPILENKKYQQYDCCLGARFMKDSKLKGYSSFRTFGNRVYNLLFSVVTGRKIFDLGSGLNMYHVDMLKNSFFEKFPDKLTFNYCMILAAHTYKHSLMFFPITWREDDQLSNVKLFSQAVKVLSMLGKYSIKRESFITSELRDSPKENYTAKIIAKNETQMDEMK
ncbi:glycosyltransferase family 2 protein [Salinibacillus xinjiangensis]|uniref:Glycosyltransferase n=1 Tax=Salinibacillus xinjiangensis TaxID=1229268 RepID=A0A6G1X2D6_9BACI|nr:glycosyltransferase family 2 protein [Salinibacillus xinjiangensis]MRG85060.1 glycosyltransferase [Salinibacillus xinjiangensis]